MRPDSLSPEERQALDHEPNAHVHPVMRGFLPPISRNQGLSADPTRSRAQTGHHSFNLEGR